jgi:hypothetical protein
MTGSGFDSMPRKSLAKGKSGISGCNNPLFSLQKSLSVKNNGVFSLSRKVLSEGTSFLWPFLKPLRQQTRRRGGSVSGKKVPLLVRRKKRLGEAKQFESNDKPLDDNAYHVLAMLFAPMITKAYQDTAKRSEAKLNPEGGFPVRLDNGIIIHVEPIEFGRIQMNTQV